MHRRSMTYLHCFVCSIKGGRNKVKQELLAKVVDRLVGHVVNKCSVLLQSQRQTLVVQDPNIEVQHATPVEKD